MHLRWLLVLLLSLPTLSRVVAQEPVPAKKARVVTLRQVLQQARTNPPAIMSALSTLKRIQAQESYARGAYIPRFTIEGGTGIQYSDQPFLTKKQQEATAGISPEQKDMLGIVDRFSAAGQNSYGRANLDYALFDLQRRYAVTSAQLSSQAQTSAYQGAQRLAVQAAAELYLRAVAAISFVDDAKLTLERRDSQWKAIASLSKAGLRPSVDATRAEIEAVGAKFLLETREIELKATQAALAVAMGDDPANPATPSGFDDRTLPAPLDPLHASALAVQRRPEVHQLELALASRRNDHRAAIGSRLPTVGLLGTANLSYQNVLGDGNGYQGRFLQAQGSVYMRWAALDPAIWRRANVTSKAIAEAQQQLEQQLLSVRAEVVEAAYQTQRARAMVDQAAQVLAAATAARTAQNERYRAGVASLLDLLDAEGIEQNARRSRIEAERDLRIARVRLLALCGEAEKLEQ